MAPRVQALTPKTSFHRSAGMALATTLLSFLAASSHAQSTAEIRYTLEPTGETLQKVTDPARIGLLEKLNRAERKRLDRLDSLVVPSRWNADELAYSPLPRRVAALGNRKKALVVDQPAQVFGAYEAGELMRWGPVSTGRRDRSTPAGAFHLNWRSRGRHSTVNPEWYMEWYFNFDNERGLSLHSHALPGVPASHACVRLLERDGRWIYDWGEEWELDERGWKVLHRGTPLWILGTYGFDSPPPWLAADDPHAERALPPGAFRVGPSQSPGQTSPLPDDAVRQGASPTIGRR